MSEKIMTLFGEELFPEAPKQPKPRAKKKQDGSTDETEDDLNGEGEVEKNEEAEPVAAVVEVAPAPPVTVPEPVVATAPEPIVVAEEVPAAVIVEEVPYQDDWKGSKQYYSIGEVAELMEIKTSKVRFWCNEFKMKIRTTKKGDRLFTPEQVKELRAIYHLVNDRKFTLAGAREKLNSRKKIEVESLDLKTSLLQLRTKLVNIKNKLS